MSEQQDDVRVLREALAGDLMAREWQHGGCDTVDGLTDEGEWWEICHPMPLDGTATYIAAASPARIARVLDALETAQRERDAALAQGTCECGQDEACRLVRERDAALAEVERLRVALRNLLAVHTGPRLNCETRSYKAVVAAREALGKEASHG